VRVLSKLLFFLSPGMFAAQSVVLLCSSGALLVGKPGLLTATLLSVGALQAGFALWYSRVAIKFLRPHAAPRLPSPLISVWMLWRLGTCFLRTPPDFCIVGAEKSGTSSLFDWMARHPQIVPFRLKETHYWVGTLGPKWSTSPLLYRSFFPTVAYKRMRRILGRPFITGECSPDYLLVPYAARCLVRANPGMRIIIILRDPVERAWSSWRMWRWPPRSSFEEALQCERRMLRRWSDLDVMSPDPIGSVLPDCLQEVTEACYLKRGLYLEQVQRYLDVFPREQILVLKAEDLFEHPAPALRRVFSFLGLTTDVEIERWGLEPVNIGQGEGEMSAATRLELRRFFREPNARLRRALGEEFTWEAEEEPDGLASGREGLQGDPSARRRVS